MAADEDAIYVDVVPKLDEHAADEIESTLRNKFSHTGDSLKESLSGTLDSVSDKFEGLGDKLKNVFSHDLPKEIESATDKIGSDTGEKIGSSLGEKFHTSLEKSMGGASFGDKIADMMDSSAGEGLGNAVGSVLGKVIGKGIATTVSDGLGINVEEILKSPGFSDAVNSFRGGNISGGLTAAGAAFGGKPADQGPFGDIAGILGNVSDVAGTFGHSGVSTVASGMQGITQILSQFAQDDAPQTTSMSSVVGDILTHAGIGAGIGAAIPGLDATGIPSIIGALVGGGGAVAHNWNAMFGDAPAVPAQAPRDPTEHAQYAAMFGDTPISNGMDASAGYGGEAASLIRGDKGGMTLGPGSSSTSANEVEVEANEAMISAGSVTLAGSISLPAGFGGASAGGGSGGGHSSSSGVAAAGGDSGSMASLYSGGGGTTLGKGAGKGGYATGGILPGDSPGHDNMIGMLPSGKAVGLEGGEGVLNNRAMGRPGVADLVASLNQHYDEGSGAGGVGGDPNSTPLSQVPTEANSSGTSKGSTQQQLGSGEGAGVSGGGMIGMAEQAGVMAAGAFGPAAQIAEQEANLAVKKGTQIAATLAAAPIETFGLSGGMMGAPSVNVMGGWPGKIIGGLIGQQKNIPNVAGSVQPPKKPTDKPDDNKEGQGESVSKGPTGAKDDPMHVNVKNQPGPPQGSATSAMSTAPAMAMGAP